MQSLIKRSVAIRPKQCFRAAPRHAAAPRHVVARLFKFGKNGLGAESAGIVGSQGRDDFAAEDVEFYFNYMGMLAVEGTYDRMYKMMENMAPVDTILLMACSENDSPKVEELLKAGANPNVADPDGRTPMQLATKADILEMLRKAGAKQPVA